MKSGWSQNAVALYSILCTVEKITKKYLRKVLSNEHEPIPFLNILIPGAQLRVLGPDYVLDSFNDGVPLASCFPYLNPHLKTLKQQQHH